MEKTKQVAYNHENPEEGFIETLTCPIDKVVLVQEFGNIGTFIIISHKELLPTGFYYRVMHKFIVDEGIESDEVKAAFVKTLDSIETSIEYHTKQVVDIIDIVSVLYEKLEKMNINIIGNVQVYPKKVKKYY